MARLFVGNGDSVGLLAIVDAGARGRSTWPDPWSAANEEHATTGMYLTRVD
jgi:hypothetical protein